MEDQSKIWIILVAGGSGVRFGSPKQFASLQNQQVLDWSLDTAKSITSNLVVVVPKDIPASFNSDTASLNLHIVHGGDTRSESVRAGLDKVTSITDLSSNEIILVHDAVRPLAKKSLFLETIRAIQNGADAAVPAIPVTDTVHSKDGEIIDRSKLMSLQTPQAFRAEIITEIHKSKPEATDDISLCVLQKLRVAYIEGDSQNLKITEPHDLETARALLTSQSGEPTGGEGGKGGKNKRGKRGLKRKNRDSKEAKKEEVAGKK